MIIPIAIIAIAFTTLAFTPAERNNAINNATILHEMLKLRGVCTTRYETRETFSKCDNTWIELEAAQFAVQSGVLENF